MSKGHRPPIASDLMQAIREEVAFTENYGGKVMGITMCRKTLDILTEKYEVPNRTVFGYKIKIEDSLPRGYFSIEDVWEGRDI